MVKRKDGKRERTDSRGGSGPRGKKLYRAVSLSMWLFFLSALAVLLLFPILYGVSGGFSAQWELEENLSPVLGTASGFAKWSLIPRAPTLQFLIRLLMDSPAFFPMFWNSVKISVLILTGQAVVGIPAAWALAKMPLPCRRLIEGVYLILMLMPFQVRMLPEYLVISALKINDTHLAVILPMIFSTFPVFLMSRFFAGVPEAVLEAARIDGAGALRSFLFVGLPLGAPGVASAAILTFLDSWNLIEQPMTFLKTRSLWPLSLFLPEITLEDAGIGFAAALLMLIPAVLVFFTGRDYLEQGIAAAAVKE